MRHQEGTSLTSLVSRLNCFVPQWCREGRCVSRLDPRPPAHFNVSSNAIDSLDAPTQADTDDFLLDNSKPSIVNSWSLRTSNQSNATTSVSDARNKTDSSTQLSLKVLANSTSALPDDESKSHDLGTLLTSTYNNPYKDSSLANKSTSTPRLNYAHQYRHFYRKPVDGNWSSWTPYGQCISECVAPGQHYVPVGVMTSHRRCNTPAPAYGGQDCVGMDTKVKLCDAAVVSSTM